MRLLTKISAFLVAIMLLPAIGSGSLFAPSAELWDRWSAHDAGNRATIDHADWSALLAKHVKQGSDGVARVSYSAFNDADRQSLKGYIARLAGTKIDGYARGEQMAYWINLYNAVTIDVILDNMPVETIRDIDISPGLLADGPWGKKLVSVQGEELSLNDIEHRILRPIWQDPRIHYGVNCASIGCPDLRASAYTGSGIDAELDAAARAYVNHPRGVTIAGGSVTVSSIYDWFIDDFGGDEAGVLAHLRQYANPDLQAKLTGITSIEDSAYDWDLNDVR
ncbi:MAG: DUF547 domain-containing protein [Pseudomonadota bacterium]